MEKNHINKREFLKRCAIGAGGLALGLEAADAFGMRQQAADFNTEMWKWHKKAHYFSQTNRGAQCGLCPNACIVPDGQRSPCHSRFGYKGELYSIAYGNPCTINVDPVEKKPLYHFLPGIKTFSLATAGCNFTCLNCQNWQISQTSPFETRNYDLMPDAVVDQALKNSCKGIAYTYAEPIAFYEYAFDTSKLAREKGIKNLFISNGYINQQPLRDICKYLDGANINLKAFDDALHFKLNGGKLSTVKEALLIMKDEGVWLEITNLIIPQWTDDMDMIGEMCAWLVKSGFQDYPLHFSRFYPMYKLTALPSTPESVLNNARKIAMDAGMNYVYIGNVPGSEAQHTHCPACKKTLIERRGYTIITNNIQKGRCGFCSREISGVWA